MQTKKKSQKRLDLGTPLLAVLVGLLLWALCSLAFFSAEGCATMRAAAGDPVAKDAACASVCLSALDQECPRDKGVLETALGAVGSMDECLRKCGEAYDLLYDGVPSCREVAP
jgi:hypothetical protein